jgi:Arc/MetJ family transcription regulator
MPEAGRERKHSAIRRVLETGGQEQPVGPTGIDYGIERCSDACLSEGGPMRTTLALDDDLVRTAQEYTGLTEKSALVREALKALIEREAARRLIKLGGSQPDFKAGPRRRPKPA